jgi:hypothetical protein
MKYIIDMIDDIRENIQNSENYTLLAMLLKGDEPLNYKNAGQKIITSIEIDHDNKKLLLGFLDGDASTKELLGYVNSLDMKAMMYEVVVKVSDKHPLMPVIGFGENNEQRMYTFFVTTPM